MIEGIGIAGASVFASSDMETNAPPDAVTVTLE